VIDAAWLASSAAVVATIGLAGIQVHEHRRPGQYRRLELRFGRDVTPEAVLAVINRIAGQHRFTCVAVETRAHGDRVRHFIAADQGTIDVFETALRAHLPSTQLEPTAAIDMAATAGGAIRLRGRLGTLRSEAPEELSAALLGSLQPLGGQEQVVLRWLLRPSRQMTVPSARDGQLVEAEERRRLRIKNEGSVALGHGTLAVTAGNSRRAAHLLARVTSVLRTRNTAYGQLRTFSRPRVWVQSLLTRQSFIFGDRYSASEICGLIAWPINAAMLPGVAIGTSPRRIPSGRLPTTGRILGVATWPGAERPIAQPLIGALSHLLIAGPTGVGKSTLMASLIEQDILSGGGLVLIDGKGDTASAVLERVPPSRRQDVIVLDCASAGPQPGLKFLGSGDPELAADVVLGVLSDLYRTEWGPLSERYLRAALVAVAHDPTGTIADIPFVFTDAVYRRMLVAKLRDPLSRSTFAGFEAMGPAERQQQLAAPLNRIGGLLGRPIVRTVLGQAEPKLDMIDVLRHDKIVVISLAPARVGGPAARLIGALSIFALFQAVQSRSGLSAHARKPFFVYIDEPRTLGDLPMPLDSLLEQARGLSVGVAIAPQSLKQLPATVQAAALTNVATRVVFRQDADDARLLARDLAGITPEDLGDLGQYEAVARINLSAGDLTPPVTLKTRRLGKPTTDGRKLARQAAERYGESLSNVDAALTAKHEPADVGAVGRKRRSA